MNQPIGVLDSGAGGLTVVKELTRQLPNEKIIYIGDTARCPYGPRTVEEVKAFTWQMVHFLLKKDVKMIVIACNTATAVVLDEIQSTLDIPVMGVIDPGARAARMMTQNGKIGVLGTLGTIKSKAYEEALTTIDHTVEVYPLACPRFVPLVESNEFNSDIAVRVVEETLQPLLREPIDSVILGCTHYPLLAPLIKNVLGNKVAIISSGDETAREVSAILGFQRKLATKAHPSHEFYTTGSPALFRVLVTEWLSIQEPLVMKAFIEKFPISEI